MFTEQDSKITVVCVQVLIVRTAVYCKYPIAQSKAVVSSSLFAMHLIIRSGS